MFLADPGWIRSSRRSFDASSGYQVLRDSAQLRAGNDGSHSLRDFGGVLAEAGRAYALRPATPGGNKRAGPVADEASLTEDQRLVLQATYARFHRRLMVDIDYRGPAAAPTGRIGEFALRPRAASKDYGVGYLLLDISLPVPRSAVRCLGQRRARQR